MSEQVVEADIAVIGGGLGGVAAGLAAAEAGLRVVITEPTDWIGGQVTSQGMSALDEHRYIETFGGTRSYYRFRERVRAYYRQKYDLPERMPDGLPLNPGNSWTSRLAFEPRVGLQALQDLLAPHIADGRLQVLTGLTPVSADAHAGRISAVRLSGSGGRQVTLRAAFYLDASELGDLLPLVNAPYVTGAESINQTGEMHAACDGPQPGCVQAFTCCLLVEHCPGENHVIPKPFGYEAWRDTQPFSLNLRRQGNQVRRHYMFTGDLPFWTARRVLDAELVNSIRPGGPAHDLSLINWDCIDYYKESLIDRSPAQQARITAEARRLSLSFLYWLQTEAPRDDGRGKGYPGLRLAPDAAGTRDGLARAPHLRESRRVLGLRRVVEQDITPQSGRGTRAAHYVDTVGIGWYPIDMHRSAGDANCGCDNRVDFDPTLPFQIPLGAMLSPAVENLIAAARNIATTHITAAAYRAQPVEWNVGESAGALAAFCASRHLSPRAVLERTDALRAFQRALLERGVPLVWTIDLPLEDPDFAAIQSCMLESMPPQRSPRGERLQIMPDQPMSRAEGGWLMRQLPGARDNQALVRLLERWREAPHIPFIDANLRAAFAAIGLPEPSVDEYPTLRQICAELAQRSSS